MTDDTQIKAKNDSVTRRESRVRPNMRKNKKAVVQCMLGMADMPPTFDFSMCETQSAF